MNSMVVLLIATGGALGSVFRFLLSELTHGLLGRAFPYGTFAVNVIGSLLIGFLVVLLYDRNPAGSQYWMAFCVTGMLGGFTTFSGFSLDTFRLWSDANYLLACVNVIASVIVCLLATGVGFVIARWI